MLTPRKVLVVMLAFLIGPIAQQGVATTQNIVAAKVIMTQGNVVAIDQFSNIRALSRRSLVYVGDTLSTSQNALLQMRFTDNALMTLREDTDFHIAEYVPGDAEKGGSAFMELISGGFRTVTGAIGKGNKDNYQVKTKGGSIGIRGTFYDAVENSEGAVLLAVWKGAVEVENQAGSMVLGDNQPYRYGHISENESPSGLKAPPAELNEPPPSSAAAQPESEGDETEGDDTNSDERENTSSAGESTQSDARAKPSDGQSAPVANAGDESSGSPAKTQVADGSSDLPDTNERRRPNPAGQPPGAPNPNVPAASQDFVDLVEPRRDAYFNPDDIRLVQDASGPIGLVDDSLSVEPDQAIENVQEEVIDTEVESGIVLSAFYDAKLTDAEKDQLPNGKTIGFVRLEGVDPITNTELPAFIQHAGVIKDANNHPVFLLPETLPSDTLYYPKRLSGPSGKLYRKGSAVVDGDVLNTNVDGLGEVSWGAWDGSGQDTSIDQSVANGASVDENAKLYWMTAEPAINANLTGTIAFTANTEAANPTPFIAGSSIGDVTGIEARFNIDFDRGIMVQGSDLRVLFDDQHAEKFWHLILDDKVMNYGNGQFFVDIDNATPSEAFLDTNNICVDCLKGGISGVLINQGNGVSSAFSLEAENTAERTEGFFLLKQ